MSGENTVTTVSAWLKEIYADKLQTLIPEGVRLLKAVTFDQQHELGNQYHQPVALTHEFGFTTGTGAFSLNAAINATYADAQVDGKQMLLRTQIAYETMAKASDSKKSFVKWSEQIVGNMTSSFTKRLEVLHFYGGTGLATVSGIASHVITVTAATWASGIWAGAEGMKLESRTSGGTSHDTGLVISSVDLVNKQITVTGDSATTTNDVLYFDGFYGAELNGLDKIITNSGTLYNISASSYALWKGNSYSAGSAKLTFKKIQQAVALGVARGLDEKVTVFCSPATWADLNTDLAALQRADNSYNKSKGEQGYEAITFYGPVEIEVVASIYVKEGEAFCVPLKRFKRIGATDVTMKMPGQSEDQLVLQMPSAAGYEMRLYYHGQLFCDRPAWCVKVSNITNDT